MGNHLERALEVGEEVPHVVDGAERDREGDEEDEVEGELPKAHEEVDKVPWKEEEEKNRSLKFHENFLAQICKKH